MRERDRTFYAGFSEFSDLSVNVSADIRLSDWAPIRPLDSDLDSPYLRTRAQLNNQPVSLLIRRQSKKLSLANVCSAGPVRWKDPLLGLRCRIHVHSQ